MKKHELIVLTFTLLFNQFAFAQERFDKVEITPTEITAGIYMLVGDGGNIGVSIGEDGVFLIDDQYAPLTPKIIAAIRTLSDKEIKFVFNTHYHDDHTGGNENLGNMGVNIVAHEDVYKRLNDQKYGQNITPEKSKSIENSLPIITFNDQLTFHMNGLNIRTKYYPHAHTDSDSVIYFGDENIIHIGDIFENGGYPYVDLDAEGSFIGIINAVDDTLNNIDDETVIIPGHGALSNKAELREYNDALKNMYEILEPYAKEGKPIEEVAALSPLKEYDDSWGKADIRPETFLKIAYASILKTIKDDASMIDK